MGIKNEALNEPKRSQDDVSNRTGNPGPPRQQTHAITDKQMKGRETTTQPEEAPNKEGPAQLSSLTHPRTGRT